jgi:hypothetical protein
MFVAHAEKPDPGLMEEYRRMRDARGSSDANDEGNAMEVEEEKETD